MVEEAATNFNVSSRQEFKLWGLSPWLPSLADPCLTLAWASQKYKVDISKDSALFRRVGILCLHLMIHKRTFTIVFRHLLKYCRTETRNVLIFQNILEHPCSCAQSPLVWSALTLWRLRRGLAIKICILWDYSAAAGCEIWVTRWPLSILPRYYPSRAALITPSIWPPDLLQTHQQRE